MVGVGAFWRCRGEGEARTRLIGDVRSSSPKGDEGMDLYQVFDGVGN